MWITLIVVLFSTVNCRSDIPEEDILEDLFYSYNRHARPSLGPYHAVTVSHSLTLTRIVSMEKHVLTADTWQMMKWRENRLTWDPYDYSQVEYINIPDELVWTPDIVLYNNAAATSGKTYASIRVVVNKTGDAVWIPGTRVTAYCEMVESSDRANISAGDFKCPLKFGSWTYHERSLNMTIDGEGLLMSDYIKNPHYDIIDYEVTRENLYYACCPDPYTSITYTLWLRRKCHKTVVIEDVCATKSNDNNNGTDDVDSVGSSDEDTNDNTGGTENNNGTDNDTGDNGDDNGTNTDDSETDSSNTNEGDDTDDDTNDDSDTTDDDADDNTDGADDNNENNGDDESHNHSDSSNQSPPNQGVVPVVQT